MTDYELRQFISENKSIIIRTIWRYVRREEDMEEILQEAIIIVLKKNKIIINSIIKDYTPDIFVEIKYFKVLDNGKFIIYWGKGENQ